MAQVTLCIAEEGSKGQCGHTERFYLDDKILATQTATANPTLSLHTDTASTRSCTPGSKHHALLFRLSQCRLSGGTSSLNAYSSSGRFYSLPFPSHGKNHSIAKVPATLNAKPCLLGLEAPHR